MYMCIYMCVCVCVCVCMYVHMADFSTPKRSLAVVASENNKCASLKGRKQGEWWERWVPWERSQGLWKAEAVVILWGCLTHPCKLIFRKQRSPILSPLTEKNGTPTQSTGGTDPPAPLKGSPGPGPHIPAAWWGSVRRAGPAWGAGSRGAAAWRAAGAAAGWDAGEEGGWSGGEEGGTRPCWLWRQSLAFGCWPWVLCSWGDWDAWRLGEGSFLAVGGSGNLGTELSGPGWARGTLTAAWHWSAVEAEPSSRQQARCSSVEKQTGTELRGRHPGAAFS